jgi:hypothetical protein
MLQPVLVTARPSADALVTRARVAGLLAVTAAAVLVALLVPRVLALLGDPETWTTLARALPRQIGGIVGRLAEAPALVAALAAMLPPVLWTAARLAGALVGSEPGPLHRGLAGAWTVSALASAAAIVFPPHELKQGLAALGYALAWPALLSAAAALWSSRLPRVLALGILLALTLAGLVARVLPLGWPGEHSLTWWAMLPSVPGATLAMGLATAAAATALVLLVVVRARRWSPRVALPVLSLAAFLLLRALPAFEHYGPEKHPAALASEINTSYFQAADSVHGARAFVREHARRMPALAMHARTHPPLWPLVFHAARRMGDAPGAARLSATIARALGADPRGAAELAASVALRPLTLAETNGLWLVVGGLALAVVALPWLVWFAARARADSAPALRAAALAALLPAPLLYFPDVDVLHPALYALAAGAWLRRERGPSWPLFAGLVGAVLAAFSFGNLALFAWFVVVAALEARAPGSERRSEPRHELRAGVLVLLPLAALVVAAAIAGAQPFTMLTTALAQHRVILAHRTAALWMVLHPLECAVGLGFPVVLAFARALDLRGLATRARSFASTGPEPLLVGTLVTLALLDLTAATKGESARLWMGWFPLILAGGAGVLATRERGWGWLALGLAGTLVVLKGFYVFVWLYKLG